MIHDVECIVIGAGVVGLACAAALATQGHEVLVLERAGLIGSETSSRNSEVIHAGIYYAPGSLKAQLCRAGKERLYAYCQSRGVPHQRLGKLIVGKGDAQRQKLATIEQRALANDVRDLEWLDPRQIRQLEADIDATLGLFSPSTGIIDSHALMLALEGDLATHGGMVVLNAPVTGAVCSDEHIMLAIGGAEPMEMRARIVINAAGLHAPDLARRFSGLPDASIPRPYYAIGHYYRLTGRHRFRHLVYPVPEAGGLGIHLTLDLGGQVKFGPDVRWIATPAYDFDDSRFATFVDAICSYYPGLDKARLHADYTGVRPKLAGPGAAEQDFRIDDAAVHGVPGLINLFGIESPGLTACLAIAEDVLSRISR